MEDLNIKIPCLPLRDICIFPGAVLHFDVGRKRSIAALESAMTKDQLIFLVTQKDTGVEKPKAKDLYPIGTVSKIKQILKLPGNSLRVLAEGIDRAHMLRLDPMTNYDRAQIQILKSEESVDPAEEEAFLRLINDALENYTAITGKVLPRADSLNAGEVADVIAASLPMSIDRKQVILSKVGVISRLESLYKIILHESQIAEAEQSIRSKVKANIEKSQREYYLREQLRTIQSELGGDETGQLDDMKEQVEKSRMSDDARQKAMRELKRLESIPSSSPEQTVSRSYVQWLLDIPWDESSEDNKDLRHARRVLDADHCGLEKVKERILEFLAVKTLTDSMKGPILCFAGPPGVGKTSIARSIARALDRKFVNMSLGGIRDEAEIRGHRRTYIGAIPGRIISMMKQAGTVNPVILFDEIDKMASDFRGDPASAMLEVLDPEQNHSFRDNYLDTAYDLSKVLFLTTANDLGSIPRPLLDRMEVINIEGYTDVEKARIARRHLIPKQAKENGLDKIKFTITPSAVSDIITLYTREAGVRNLEREIAKICRKTACDVLEMDVSPPALQVKKEDLQRLLGPPRFHYDKAEKQPQVGVATGLAWTPYGGVTLSVEVSTMPGKGEIQLTGQLGNVMKESARAALSYIRMRHKELGVPEDFYSKTDIHIHVPEGATPKDGPSAGVTLALAMASALSGKPVRQDTAMTGEITLRGRVLPIGGLKEKTLAAYRSGIKRVLYPVENEKDVADIPDIVKNRLEMIPISDVSQIFTNSFLG
ncbi:MAG: endopeptidase La [Christensenellales bacterium]|jgi:ATP-dependent Lon protease